MLLIDGERIRYPKCGRKSLRSAIISLGRRAEL
jgi:hypothetical protein